MDMLVDTEAAFSSLNRQGSLGGGHGSIRTSVGKGSIGSDSDFVVKVPVERKGTFINTMSRKDAVAIGEAFKDALANPNWDRSSSES